MPDPTRKMITAPGIFHNLDPTDYHADPLPEPSFTQSIAKTLLSHSPRHAMLEHPRLRPAPAEDDEAEKYVKAKVIGDAAHLLLLGRGKRLAVFDAADWNATGGGKGAKAKLHEERDDAVAAGKLPILAKHYDVAERMILAARRHLAEHDPDLANIGIADGFAEVTIAWQRDGLWCRSLIDWLDVDRFDVVDYKSTGLCAAPHALDKLMVDAGWPIQGAMHRDGLDTVDPERAGRRRHIFIAQEQYEPFELTVSVLPESALTMGRKELDMAWAKWSAAVRSGRWSGYPRIIQHPHYPAWMESRILEREIAHAEEHEERRRADRSIDNMMAG